MTPSLFTIGFTKTTAEHFFARLAGAEVRQIVDVRLNTTGQLSGFAKQRDLVFFAHRLCGIGYRHAPHLAPELEMLRAYRNGATPWPAYADQFLGLMDYRRIDTIETPDGLSDACLLCSEDTPHQCHRRLVAEYLNDRWGGAVLTVVHL